MNNAVDDLRSALVERCEALCLPMLNALNRLVDRYPILERIPVIPRWMLWGVWIAAGIVGVLAGATQ